MLNKYSSQRKFIKAQKKKMKKMKGSDESINSKYLSRKDKRSIDESLEEPHEFPDDDTPDEPLANSLESTTKTLKMPQ